jgi:hypothetical protein
MQEKKAVTRQIRSRYQKAGRKEKSAILDEFIWITGYKNRKYALRILNQPPVPQALLVVNGKAVKLKPQKKNRQPERQKNLYRGGHRLSLPHLDLLLYKCGRKQSFRRSWLPLSASKCPSSPPGPLSALPPLSGKSS